MPDICIHCGSVGAAEFLFGHKELEAKNMTGGRKCYPIFRDCLEDGKKVINYPKQKVNQTQKRKEDASKKTADQRAKKAKA